jgi:Transposase DDE domain
VDVPKVPALSAAAQLAGLLDSPEIAALVSELEATRWTGRPGYPLRSMVGMALAKSIYAVPTWTRTVALVREHAALRLAIAGDGDVPSVYAVYRFTAKLRTYSDMLAACIDRVTASLHAANPDMGRDVAIDGSDMPAYANGQRFVSKNGPERERFSDPDATWGHRSAVSTRKGGGYYGYKIHAAVCVVTGLPLAWTVETASAAETTFALPLIDAVRERGFAVKAAIADKGYDNGPFHEGCMDRDVAPITPLRKTPAVVRGDHKPPCCDHGEWTFAGADYKRRATKWRCPTGECKPASRWVKADRLHPLVPRHTDRSRKLYRSRGAVEREFGRLKHEWALAPLRVRGLDRVRLHADLTILAKLSCALSRARVVPLAA